MTNFALVDWAFGGMMTAVGMGVVFSLLAVLWLLLRLIGRLDEADADEPVPLAPVSAPTVTMVGADGMDDDTIAAIAVAVIKHADVRRKQAAPEMRTAAPGSQLWASRWVSVGRGRQNAPWRRH
jgi:glutaconyl-CoA/methylmalonyl-CoA decarboxylase subunit delta